MNHQTKLSHTWQGHKKKCLFKSSTNTCIHKYIKSELVWSLSGICHICLNEYTFKHGAQPAYVTCNKYNTAICEMTAVSELKHGAKM